MARRLLTLLALAALAGLTPACPDTEARLDRFVEQSDPLRVGAITAECTAPADMSGEFLLSVAAVIGPATPILLLADVTVDLDANTITVAMQPLTVDGREPVGEVSTATGDLDAEGGFVLDFGEVPVPADANPILPGVDVAAELALSGCTANEDFSCGAAEGQVTVPTTVPLAGSSWAMIRLDPDAVLSEVEVIAGCPE